MASNGLKTTTLTVTHGDGTSHEELAYVIESKEDLERLFEDVENAALRREILEDVRL